MKKKSELTVTAALRWAAENFPYVALSNGNNRQYPNGAFRTLLACSTGNIISATGTESLEKLNLINGDQWWFGYFGYDLKNTLEDLSSNNSNTVEMPDLFFFTPEILLEFTDKGITILLGDEGITEHIAAFAAAEDKKQLSISRLSITPDKNTYLEKIKHLQDLIREGDIYEVNFCLNCTADIKNTNPLKLYERLNSTSPMPFSYFLKIKDKYLISASPERFLKKSGEKLISQPIKGTRKRSDDPYQDKKLKDELKYSEKDRAENLMIVDLVRNDLAKGSLPGSVKVEELFGVYSFSNVHQMISTVSSTVREQIPFTRHIINAFPMGSMTGTPKIRAMEIIEEFENFKRGVFSGAAGYFSPGENFDLNVVIRSMILDAEAQTLSFPAGSAITLDSVAEEEYEECLAKVSAILSVLSEKEPDSALL